MPASAWLASVADFARALREGGVRVPEGGAQLFAEALSALDAAQPRALYWAARLSLLRRRDDLERFDRIFEAYWTGVHAFSPAPLAQERRQPPAGVVQLVPTGAHTQRGEHDEHAEELPASLASSLARLREIDFSAYTEHEHRLAARLMEQVRLSLPMRRSRRVRPSPRGHHVDIPRTLRRSLRTAGDPVRLVYRRRREKARPLILLCDVSGSMSAYSRALVQFLRAAIESHARVRVFAFGTRLVELTRPLSVATRDQALQSAAKHFDDWGGGTRIGASLSAFVHRFAQRGATRGGIVVVLSDGWEREDPALVGEQMRRLRLLSHRIIWVNPNKRDPRFEPLAAGMASALPYIDALVAGHNLRALDELAVMVRRLGEEGARS